jgi:hypothetical protein
LAPSLELELHGLPQDPNSSAQISLEGEMTTTSVAVDAARFLLRAVLAAAPGAPCEMSDSQVEQAAIVVTPVVEPALSRAWEGNLPDALEECGALLPVLLEQSAIVLEENGPGCTAASLAAAVSEPAVLQKLRTQFSAWLPVELYAYFQYQKQPARVELEYRAAPAGTVGPEGNTPTQTPTRRPPTATPPVGPYLGQVATVGGPVADVWPEPRVEAGQKRETQVLMGEQVHLTEIREDWFGIVVLEQPSSKDARGYPGWIQRSALVLKPYDPDRFIVVMVPSTYLYSSSNSSSAVIDEISLDTRLGIVDEAGDWIQVELPRGD